MEKQAAAVNGWSGDTRSGPVQVSVLVAAAVLATAWLSVELSRDDGYIAAIWVPNAIVACALIRIPPGSATWVLGPTAAAYVATYLLTGTGPVLSVALAGCHLLEAAILAFGFRRFNPQVELRQLKSIAVFGVLALGVAPVVSGIAAMGLQASLAGASYRAVLEAWYPANALGLLIVTPLLLSLRRDHVARVFSDRRWFTAAAILGFVILATALVFSQTRFPLLFLVGPSLVLASFRLGLTGSSLAVLGVAIVAMVATKNGLGPLMLVEGAEQERILIFQGFIAFASLTCLPAASLAQLERMSEDLRFAKEQAETSEAAHREVSGLLQTTLDTMDQGIFMADTEGRLKVYNRRTLELLDLPPEVMSGAPTVHDILAFQRRRGDFDAMPADERHKLGPAVEDGKLSIYEREGPNHTVLEVRTAPIVGGGAVRTYTDVTARRTSERKLAENEALFRLLAEHASDIIARIALDGSLRYISPAVNWILGFAADEIVGQRSFGTVHPDDAAGFESALSTVSSGSADDVGCSYRCRHRDGHWVWLETQFRLVRDTRSNVALELIACTRDISERQAQAEQLELAREAAETSAEVARAASNAKSEFLARMSHELRTPLNAVLGFAQMLQLNKSGNLTPAQLEYAGHIAKGGNHLLELVNELLDLSGIESGRMKLSIEPVGVLSALGLAADEMRPIAERAQVDLQVDLQVDDVPSDLLVSADVQRLRQILMNLLSNAFKYNTAGGRVVVTARRMDTEMVRISVQDDGHGIAAELQPLIFEPFNRLGAEYTAVEGNGIGLALSRRLVEAMHGRIGFESEAGEGSTFWIELPTTNASVAPADSDAERPVVPPQVSERFRILYVEDNPINLMLMESVIDTVPGATLMSAPSGMLGLDMAANGAPDVIVLDLHLPGMNGFEVLKRLKSDPGTEDIPVIALTASAMPRDVSRGLEAGFFRYLTKPLDVPTLFRAVGDALDVRPGDRGRGSALRARSEAL